MVDVPDAVRQHPIFHPEALEWFMEQVRTNHDEDEFLAQLRLGFHGLIDRAIVPSPDPDLAMKEFMSVLNGISDWMLSYQLAASPQWQKQIDESAKELETGNVGPAVPTCELRKALASL